MINSYFDVVAVIDHQLAVFSRVVKLHPELSGLEKDEVLEVLLKSSRKLEALLRKRCPGIRNETVTDTLSVLLTKSFVI
jgi:hypothetical protein